MNNEGIEFETCFLPFAEAILACLAAQPLVLVMDGSVMGRGCVTLMLSVVYQRRALPIAWMVVRGRKGHFPEDAHLDLVKQAQAWVPEGAQVIFLGDGEFDGTQLLATLNEWGWHYAYGPVLAVAWWEADQKEPIYLVSNLTYVDKSAAGMPNASASRPSFRIRKAAAFICTRVTCLIPLGWRA